jgi:hypothetical protein
MAKITYHIGKSFLLLIFTCFIISAFSLYSNAQLGYSKGYIITHENDTIHGFISDRGDVGNAAVCMFKENKQGQAKKYYPGDIRAYRFDEGNYYFTAGVIDHDEKMLSFTEVLVDGKIALLYYCKNNELSYYIRSEDGSVVGLPNKILTLRKKTPINVTASFQSSTGNFMIASYKDSLEKIFKNCYAIIPKIKDVEYDAKSLINISKEYINCTCNNDHCVTYEKNRNQSGPSFGVYSGVHLSQVRILESSIKSTAEVAVPIGLFVNVPITLLNEKISFQAELQARKLNYKQFDNIPDIYTSIQMNATQVSIPLSIRYSFYPKKLRPTIGIGKEFAYSFNTRVYTAPPVDFPDGYIKDYRNRGFFTHYYSKGGWFVDLGADYRISSTLMLYSNLRFSSCLNLIIEEQNYSNFSFNMAAEKNNIDNPHSNIYRTNSASLFLGLRF